MSENRNFDTEKESIITLNLTEIQVKIKNNNQFWKCNKCITIVFCPIVNLKQ